MDKTHSRSVEDQVMQNSSDFEELGEAPTDLGKSLQELKQNLKDLKHNLEDYFAFMKAQFPVPPAALTNKKASSQADQPQVPSEPKGSSSSPISFSDSCSNGMVSDNSLVIEDDELSGLEDDESLNSEGGTSIIDALSAQIDFEEETHKVFDDLTKPILEAYGDVYAENAVEASKMVHNSTEVISVGSKSICRQYYSFSVKPKGIIDDDKCSIPLVDHIPLVLDPGSSTTQNSCTNGSSKKEIQDFKFDVRQELFHDTQDLLDWKLQIDEPWDPGPCMDSYTSLWPRMFSRGMEEYSGYGSSIMQNGAHKVFAKLSSLEMTSFNLTEDESMAKRVLGIQSEYGTGTENGAAKFPVRTFSGFKDDAWNCKSREVSKHFQLEQEFCQSVNMKIIELDEIQEVVFIFDPGIRSWILSCASVNPCVMTSYSNAELWVEGMVFVFDPGGCVSKSSIRLSLTPIMLSAVFRNDGPAADDMAEQPFAQASIVFLKWHIRMEHTRFLLNCLD